MKEWCVLVNSRKSCFSSVRYALAFAKAKRVYSCYTYSSKLGKTIYATCKGRLISFTDQKGKVYATRKWGNYRQDGRPMPKRFRNNEVVSYGTELKAYSGIKRKIKSAGVLTRNNPTAGYYWNDNLQDYVYGNF